MPTLLVVVAAFVPLRVADAGALRMEAIPRKPLLQPNLAHPQLRLTAWSAKDFPDPRANPALCKSALPKLPNFTGQRKLPTSTHQPKGLLFCDPEGLAKSSAAGASEIFVLRDAAQAFLEQLSAEVLGDAWGMSLGIALLAETVEPLSAFATALASAWGLDGPRGLLLVLRGDGPPSVEFGGGLRSPAFATSTARSQAIGLVAGGQFPQAVLALLRGVAEVIGGVTLRAMSTSGPSIEQRLLADWDSPYQKVEIWENSCGERRCLELFLGMVRQLSDRFEAYYHEAMVFPVLNALGAERGRRMLVLGGGDGGIVTHALKYSSVERVLAIELDGEVVVVSKKWFPAVSAGYDDPRCQLMLSNALAWVRKQAANKRKGDAVEEFDVVVIDFTDDPVEGTWTLDFFIDLKSLLSPWGVLVQNAGTIETMAMTDLLALHAEVFNNVYPLNTCIPDYLANYIVFLSADETDPRTIHQDFWREQGIFTKYYSADIHKELFVHPAKVSAFLGLPVPTRPTTPSPLTEFRNAQFGSFETGDFTPVRGHRDGQKAFAKSPYNDIKIMRLKSGHRDAEVHRALVVNGEFLLNAGATSVYETKVYAVMNVLGVRARRVLVLGGGHMGLVKYALRFPTVERVVVVEIDQELVNIAGTWFPGIKQTMRDPRVELRIGSPLDWLANTSGSESALQFDAMFLELTDKPWRLPSQASRAPRFQPIYEALRGLLAPHGLLLQEIGSLATIMDAWQLASLHRSVFASTWFMHFSKVPSDNLEQNMEELGYPLDSILSRPPQLLALSSRDPLFDPLTVDWGHWERLRIEGMQAEFYHASMHRRLFVLPAELQRHLVAPVPRVVARPPPASDEL